MQNWIYKQGFQRGEAKGMERVNVRFLHAVFVHRVGRQPTAEEEQALTRRAKEVSPEQFVDFVEMPPETFLRWLTAP